ncbi:MAG: nickel-dependent lactate racemase [Alkaliphilus sp.]|nr:nickel-dependent lactate racemase [Alkaliphilus sp.]
MIQSVKMGMQLLEFSLDEKNSLGTLIPNQTDEILKEEIELKRAMENPIHSERLCNIVSKGEKVVIITSDITRPMPSEKVLPFVLEELHLGGVNKENITIVLALGSHRKHTETEMKKLVGEAVYDEYTVIDSDMGNCVNLGTCRNGTPVDIFEPVVKADRIVCLGNVEYHYFAGYSGGAKAIMPGVSSHEAIQANHSNMVKVEAHTGNLTTNPVRQDIDEVGQFIKIDFILNVVINSKKEILKAYSGNYIDAHREACNYLDRLYKIKLIAPADVVIVSAGGYPKDINLYQAQKALDNAKHAVKKGGIIIWVASCKEGFGEKTFENWMLNKTPHQMIQDIKESFVLGGHKAASIAMVLQHCKIYFVSDLEDQLINGINLVPFKTVQDAVESAIIELGENSKVLVMPYGGSTLPMVCTEK